ncbi:MULTISPECIES: DUF3800 domain-containing protein [Actinomyces]|uniref:DUF3800 domain-containing protein n=1 Tax=Actinomyces respiraculi TaxID=2744574 RepID=A0A7T0LLW5_9ACTO|nr:MULTISPECIES: DUF3800 domain-containing protein [Actinomyces]QPL05758.1 DUF3800 domain-containing protein [Actinomyces respiraculi]
MLLAYIDEIGETGAFVSHEHLRFHTSAAFGYAGFIIPEEAVRGLGARFAREKRNLFAAELADVEHPGRWERKGASIFQPTTPDRYPQQLRVFNALVGYLRSKEGFLFYYADEKPLGTAKQTRLDPAVREAQAMEECLNRLARHADTRRQNILVMIDQINEKTRADRLPKMYGHILGRASEHREMRRIVEPPMHIDSELSSGIQLADWVAACVTRAIDYQLVRTSRHQWIVETPLLTTLQGAFTYESKAHLHQRAVDDIVHSDVFKRKRPLYPVPIGQHLGASIDPDVARKMRGIAESRRN